MQEPLVSVIMPYYCDTGFFKDSVSSVLNQTSSDLELIIVDDCSQDNGIHCLGNRILSDNRLKILRNSENIGAGLSRNMGIKESKGTWLAFCDSDDIWMPKKLETHLRYIMNNNVDFTFSSYELYKNNRPLNIRHARFQVNYTDLLKSNYIGCSTVMLNKKALNGLEFNAFRNRQDWCLWLDITARGSIFYGINEVLVIYNKSNESLSSNKIKMVQKNFAVYYHHLNYSLIRSIIRMFIFLAVHLSALI
ncbi:glycosyltransferase, partial [Schleiferiaceae bacterium]|nr:glycosyltransferase [Schleiferiaceae bacterium]